jgi:peptidoglycan LD-endopeptidase LytH
MNRARVLAWLALFAAGITALLLVAARAPVPRFARAVPGSPAANAEPPARPPRTAVPAGPRIDRLPIEGLRPSDIVGTFNQTRGGGSRHEAIDIAAPRGTPVVAAVDGVIQKLFASKAGGLTIYEFDQAGKYAYYYAHLDRYEPGLVEGMPVKAGDRIGYVGTTGNAPPGSPHLHFAVFLLGPDRRWWEGIAVDPYEALQKRAGNPLQQ